MINRAQIELNAMDALINAKEKTDITTTGLQEFRDENNLIHTMYVSMLDNSSESQTTLHVRRIYETLTIDPVVKGTYSKYIEMFENEHQIDIITFISYVYMKNNGDKDRLIKTCAQVIETLINKVGGKQEVTA